MLIRNCAAFLFATLVCVPSLYAQPDDHLELGYDPIGIRYAMPVTAPPSMTAIQPTIEEDAALEQTLHSDNSVLPCACSSCAASGVADFWHADFDFTILTTHYYSPLLQVQGKAIALGPRLEFGKERNDGFGWRTRFWGISGDSEIVDTAGIPTGAIFDIAAHRIDLDFYRRFRFPHASMLFGAGLTYASLESELSDPNGFDTAEDTGTGVNVFAEGRHLFLETDKSEWSLIGRGKWAYLAGDGETTLSTSPAIASSLDIAEAAFGFEYVRRLRRGNLLIQCLMEAQSWDTTLNRQVNYLGSSYRIGYYW